MARSTGSLNRVAAIDVCLRGSHVSKRRDVGTALSPHCWYQQKYQQLVRLAAHFGEHPPKSHQLSHRFFVTFEHP
jgi:hypothetical protein